MFGMRVVSAITGSSCAGAAPDKSLWRFLSLIGYNFDWWTHEGQFIVSLESSRNTVMMYPGDLRSNAS